MTIKKVTYKSFPIVKGILIALYLGSSLFVVPFLLAMLTLSFESPGTQYGGIIFYTLLLGLYVWGFTKLIEANFDKRSREQKSEFRTCFKIKSDVNIQQLLDWMDEEIKNTEIRSIKIKIISQKNFEDFYIVDSSLDIYSKDKLTQSDLEEMFKNRPTYIFDLVFI